MSLNDNHIAKQIQNMISFIQQEAAEKVEEIEAKAEEEFNIEKSRLVSQQRVKIIEYYDKKEKQIELQRKIQHSNLANSSRLAILKARDDYIQALKEETRKQLINIMKNRSKYIFIFANILIESLFILMESNITIKCRQDDYGLIIRLLPDTIRKYKKKIKNENINIIVDNKNFLSDNIIGGIELYSMQEKIKLSNTIENRLERIFNDILPEIQRNLFGINQHRKFYN